MGQLLDGLVPVAAEQVDPQINRGTPGQGCAFLGCTVTKGRDEGLCQPFRVVTAHMGGGLCQVAAFEALKFLRGEGLGCMRLAVEQGDDGFGVETALQSQHAEHGRARILGAHEPACRGPATQGVIDERANGVAVLGAGEPMRGTPFLQRLHGGAMARLDGFEHFDGGGYAGCRRHDDFRCGRRLQQVSHSAA